MHHLRQALTITRDLSGPKNIETGVAYVNVGVASLARGNSKQASEYFDKGLEIYLLCYGRNHPA